MSVVSIEHIFISPSKFLAEEENALCKHEYLNVVVYAMAGGTIEHSQIGGNIASALKARLRGKPAAR